MTELGSKRSPESGVFKAALIYGLINLALLPFASAFIGFIILAPAFICLAQFLDSRRQPKTRKTYKRTSVGLAIYVVFGVLILPIASIMLFTAIIPSEILPSFYANYFILLLNAAMLLLPVLIGAFILAATFPNASFRGANGGSSALFWITIISVIIGIISVVIFMITSNLAGKIGEAF